MRLNAFNITTPTGGGSFPVDVTNPTKYVYLTTTAGGAITLGAAANITASGTPVDGTMFRFICSGQITADTTTGKSVTIFGITIPDVVVLYEFEAIAFFNGTGWQVSVFPTAEGDANLDGAQLTAGSVPTAALADDAVTLTKMAGISRGNFIIGDSSGDPAALDLSAAGAVPMGDGNDIVARVLGSAGPVAFDPASGNSSINAGSITESMLGFTLADLTITKTTISSAQILAGCSAVGGTPIELIPAQGANTVIMPVAVAAFLDHGGVNYAAGGVPELTFDNGGTTIWQGSTALITAAADTFEEWAPQRPLLTTAVNKGIYFDNATAAFTTGNGSLDIWIAWKTIDFS